MKIRRHYWAFSLSRHLHPVTKATGVKLGPHPQHMETYGSSWARGWIGAGQIPALSLTYTTAQSNAAFLSHWAELGIGPVPSWILVGFVSLSHNGNLATQRYTELLGQGLDLSHSCNLRRSFGNAGTLTHCVSLGMEPASQHFQDATDPVHHRGNSSPCVLYSHNRVGHHR